jgi:hypothetical protein
MHASATLDPVICLACGQQADDPLHRCSRETSVHLSSLIRYVLDHEPRPQAVEEEYGPARPTSIRALLDGES